MLFSEHFEALDPSFKAPPGPAKPQPTIDEVKLKLTQSNLHIHRLKEVFRDVRYMASCIPCSCAKLPCFRCRILTETTRAIKD